MENLKKCECCGNMYPYTEEPPEVQEGGNHICSDCWNEEDNTPDTTQHPF